MKICPSCRRTYDDDGLNFCLEDGSLLTFAPAIDPGAPTVVMRPPRSTDPSPVRGLPTGWAAQSPDAYSMQPKKKSKAWMWAVGILGFALLLCGGGVALVVVSVGSLNDTRPTVNASRASSNTNLSTAQSNISANANANSNRDSITPAGTVEEIKLEEWVKKTSIWGSTEFKDGEFLIAAKQKGYYYVLVASDDFETKDAVTRVVVRNPDSVDSSLGYGLIIHSDTTPLENDYAFLIDTKRRRFRVVRHEPEKEQTVTAWTNSRLINEGSAENLLEVRDKGGKIELYINSQLATTILNKQGPTSGVPGLYAGDGAKIGFKRLEIVK